MWPKYHISQGLKILKLPEDSIVIGFPGMTSVFVTTNGDGMKGGGFGRLDLWNAFIVGGVQTNFMIFHDNFAVNTAR